ncbi:MAG: hypothetical protein ACMV1B_04170 [Prevotella sp.]
METKPFFAFKAFVVREYITIPKNREKKNFSMLGIRDNQKLTLNVHNKFASNLNQTLSGNVYSLNKRFNKNKELVVTLSTTLWKLPESVKEIKTLQYSGETYKKSDLHSIKDPYDWFTDPLRPTETELTMFSLETGHDIDVLKKLFGVKF